MEQISNLAGNNIYEPVNNNMEPLSPPPSPSIPASQEKSSEVSDTITPVQNQTSAGNISFDYQKETQDPSEKDFPIQLITAFIGVPATFFFVALYIVLDDDFSINPLHRLPIALFIALSISTYIVVKNLLYIKFFHYAFSDKGIVIKQGVIRKQQRIIPYHVVQNIHVGRGIHERILGLSNVVIENAADSGMEAAIVQSQLNRGPKNQKNIFGNAVKIPGLKRDNAKRLKELLLQKIKDNPTQIDIGL